MDSPEDNAPVAATRAVIATTIGNTLEWLLRRVLAESQHDSRGDENFAPPLEQAVPDHHRTVGLHLNR